MPLSARAGQRSFPEPQPAAAWTGPTPSRLLAGVPPRGAWQTLAQHRTRYAQPPAPKIRPWTTLIDAVEQAGLRGRGGAGFPTAIKMRSVADGRGRPIVVANGTEGEPASYKDRMLLMTQPHLVIDGALLAAAAVGADQVVIAVDRTASAAHAALNRALDERAQSERGIPVQVAATPPGYVSGEETALVHFLNGGGALPTTVPPRPYERGVARRPTLINNVETLAHLAQIARDGPEWFRQTGTRDDPGTMLVTVSGVVGRRGVLEIALGTPLGTVIEQARPSSQPAAALVGGFFGTWVPAAGFGLPLSGSGLAPSGASPGAGVVIAIPEGACGLAETVRIMCWFANETAGQCGPCVFGLPAMAREAVGLCYGPVPAHGLTRLQRWASEVEGRGACKHPDGSVRILRSALVTFAGDIDRHVRGYPCAGSAAAPVISVPGVGARPSGPRPSKALPPRAAGGARR
jgi:NADH:ubiquinone oxidoreductase subunit F (NADH-binding)